VFSEIQAGGIGNYHLQEIDGPEFPIHGKCREIHPRAWTAAGVWVQVRNLQKLRSVSPASVSGEPKGLGAGKMLGGLQGEGM
jgi:hypothetical protein